MEGWAAGVRVDMLGMTTMSDPPTAIGNVKSIDEVVEQAGVATEAVFSADMDLDEPCCGSELDPPAYS